jgi:putative DNA primase/helicase
VNRDDRFGRYRPIERRGYGKCLVERSPVTLELLERHFRGENKHDLIGLHVVGKDGTCRWIALNFDKHDSCETTAGVNQAAALEIASKAEDAGLMPLILDSDGGGIHLLVIFEHPIPSDVSYRLARWLIEG